MQLTDICSEPQLIPIQPPVSPCTVAEFQGNGYFMCPIGYPLNLLKCEIERVSEGEIEISGTHGGYQCTTASVCHTGPE